MEPIGPWYNSNTDKFEGKGDVMDFGQMLGAIKIRFGSGQFNTRFIAECPEFDLSCLAQIDHTNLQHEMDEQIRMYLFFSTMLSFASDELNQAEAELKRYESGTYISYEHKIKSGDVDLINLVGSRVSDTKINHLVNNDPDVSDKENIAIRAKRKVSFLTAIVKSLEKRHDILIQLSTKNNKEIGAKLG